MAYAIIGVLVVAFIAFVILSAKAWHWSNIVFLSLCFLTGLGGLIAMAQVLQLRRAQMLEVKKIGEQLERVESEIDDIRYGAGFTDEYAPDSLLGLSATLALEQAGQGRVWKTGVVEASGENRIFRFTAERIQAEENPAKMDDMLLFAFADQQFDNQQIYPVQFVGSFRVAEDALDANLLTLEPVNVFAVDEYNSPSTTWTLYEKAPIDQRDAFIRNTDLILDPEDSQLNEKLTKYREILTTQFLPAELFGFNTSNEEQAKDYELLVDRIMFDGLPLAKIESWIESQSDRISQRFDPTNEEIVVRYRFNENSKKPYQVDSTGNIDADGLFTPNGRAVDPALHAGGEITFQKGDEILIDQLSADGYQRGDEVVESFASSEPVTEIERLFVRRLNDYPFLLKSLQRQYQEYSEEIARVDANNRRSQQAIQDTQNQSNERDKEIELLLEDQEKFESDVQVASAYVDQIKLKRDDIETKLRNLDQEIKTRHRKIKHLSRKIAKLDFGKTSTTFDAIEQIAPSSPAIFESSPTSESFGSDDLRSIEVIQE